MPPPPPGSDVPVVANRSPCRTRPARRLRTTQSGSRSPIPPELNRWLPLVKWLLVIPHFIVLFFVAIGAFFVGIFAFFAVLFTGRYPRGAFDYMTGTLRWAYRVLAYAHLMVDPYPPLHSKTSPTTRCGCRSSTRSGSPTGARSCNGCSSTPT